VALPVLIHGDASFAAQASWRSVQVAGSRATPPADVHLIANNQLASHRSEEGRLDDYSTPRQGLRRPIIHVNADDASMPPAVRLAMLYRDKFHGDG